MGTPYIYMYETGHEKLAQELEFVVKYGLFEKTLTLVLNTWMLSKWTKMGKEKRKIYCLYCPIVLKCVGRRLSWWAVIWPVLLLFWELIAVWTAWTGEIGQKLFSATDMDFYVAYT